MRKALGVAAVVLGLAGCAGMQPVSKDEMTFSYVVEAPGYTKGQIYDGARVWVAETFRSAKAVLEYENKEAGTLIGNGVSMYPCSGIECMGTVDWRMRFTMRVEAKDDKFRLTFSNLELVTPRLDSPMTSKRQIDGAKGILGGYGDAIKASLGKDAARAEW